MDMHCSTDGRAKERKRQEFLVIKTVGYSIHGYALLHGHQPSCHIFFRLNNLDVPSSSGCAALRGSLSSSPPHCRLVTRISPDNHAHHMSNHTIISVSGLLFLLLCYPFLILLLLLLLLLPLPLLILLILVLLHLLLMLLLLLLLLHPLQ